MTTRFLTLLMLTFTLALPARAERPRPLGWGMDAMRAGNWSIAEALSKRDGAIGADIIEWHRLRAGRGDFAALTSFLSRRPDWPGEPYLRRKSEKAVIEAGDEAILSFFSDHPPQTASGALAYANAKGSPPGAKAALVLAWQTLPMERKTQEAYLEGHEEVLEPHHITRLSNLLWRNALQSARRMLDLVPEGERALALARIALQERAAAPNPLIDKIPPSLADDPGLAYDRFVWRAAKGLGASAKEMLMQRSVSAAALGRPESWANRRRAYARAEMRSGDAKRAYQMASQHHLSTGPAYADLEWLSGYIALRKLKDPATALVHFQKFDRAVRSPISRARAGYWLGRSHEALNHPAKAARAYEEAAQYQTAFYGLLAAERAGIPFNINVKGEEASPEWRGSEMAAHPLFQAGMLLQASGELSTAERFWTHYAERLSPAQAAQLGQAALDMGQPHLAVMIAKRVARRGIVLPKPYYPLHLVAYRDLPMAPEMVLAIARRESEFDPRVKSPVGARGLMQIMPATAKEVASGLNRLQEHSTERLTGDPLYNADLGAAYLSTLARRFQGNVILMSAAYNAGPGRPLRWMDLFGDPRREDVDMVDWIEHIPFRETRNYVMRVTESLPLYRARLHRAPLPVPFSQELTGSTLQAFAPQGKQARPHYNQGPHRNVQ